MPRDSSLRAPPPPLAPPARDLAVTLLVALLVRLGVAWIAGNRFPPADDGVLYDALAERLARGLGYTWAWADGTVTRVAHYPVGYPAMLAVAYRALGEHPASAASLNAFVGAIGAVCVHVVASHGTTRRAARWGGLAVALHPALLSYTPAVMTEGVCGALLAVPFALAVTARGARRKPGRAGLDVLTGATLGLAALVRPQALLVTPLVAWLAGSGRGRRRLATAAVVVASTFCAILPWTLRNARVLGRPVLVSANSGWNLLIGTDPDAHGGWRALEPPPECREVWGEADKDACFGLAARRRIAREPASFLGLVPDKLAATLDLAGSGGSYLSRSRPDLVSRGTVLALGAVETVLERVALLVALLVLGFARGPRRRWRNVLGALSSAFLLTRHAWPAYVGLSGVLGLWGRRELERIPLGAVALGLLGETFAVHGLFFGASRYALVVVGWVGALAAAAVAIAAETRVEGVDPLTRGPL